MSDSLRVEKLTSCQGQPEEASSALSIAILSNLTRRTSWMVGIPPSSPQTTRTQGSLLIMLISQLHYCKIGRDNYKYGVLETFLDWSRREDIQARTVKGLLSWTGRRYQAGTVRVRPNWFGSLLPEVQGTSSWFISWMLEQHEDQAQSLKSSSSAESSTELKCRVEAQNAQVQNSSSADQVQFPQSDYKPASWYRNESSWETSLVQTSSKTSWEGNQLRNQLAQDQFCGELNGEQTGKLVKDKPAWEQLRTNSRIKLVKVKPAQRTERSSWMRRGQLKRPAQINQSGQANQFEQSTKTNLIGSN
ncbi:hypothetical protein F511_11655 [Dorcoceras hygrometricum]|uniref:Uncharacterized protein n=1 Tax=Dorcoceras hygrometricum TaxID=472368 RepID=A0A2Z7ARX7_9LAMI|nr:hypothetical protein F511_11655 [Dorcoceras hygrometricum]